MIRFPWQDSLTMHSTHTFLSSSELASELPSVISWKRPSPILRSASKRLSQSRFFQWNCPMRQSPFLSRSFRFINSNIIKFSTYFEFYCILLLLWSHLLHNSKYSSKKIEFLRLNLYFCHARSLDSLVYFCNTKISEFVGMAKMWVARLCA